MLGKHVDMSNADYVDEPDNWSVSKLLIIATVTLVATFSFIWIISP